MSNLHVEDIDTILDKVEEELTGVLTRNESRFGQLTLEAFNYLLLSVRVSLRRHLDVEETPEDDIPF